MRTILATLLVLLMSGTGFAKTTLSFGSSGEVEQKTWKSKKQNISFVYPSDWGPEQSRDDGGVKLYKAGKGWFELSLVKLPDGETLKGFSEHLIKKSKSDNWDIRLKKDLGEKTIGDKTAWVHQYRHKKKKRTYYGYHFVAKGNIGIRVLMVKISTKGGDTMMEMLKSLRYPQSAVSKTPLPAKDSSDAKKAFGTYQDDGNVKGKVWLKNMRDKSAYPCYLSFKPAKQVKGRGRSRDRDDYKAVGDSVLTATDDNGKYHVTLEKGTYIVDVYSAKGNSWKLIKGDVLHLRGSRKLHNCKIDN